MKQVVHISAFKFAILVMLLLCCCTANSDEAIKAEKNAEIVKALLSDDVGISDNERLKDLKKIVSKQSPKAISLSVWLFSWNFEEVVKNGLINSVIIGIIPDEWGFKQGVNSLHYIDLPFLATQTISLAIVITPPINSVELQQIVDSHDLNSARDYSVVMHLQENR